MIDVYTTIRYLSMTVIMRCLLDLVLVVRGPLRGPWMRQKAPVVLVRGECQSEVRGGLRVSLLATISLEIRGGNLRPYLIGEISRGSNGRTCIQG